MALHLSLLHMNSVFILRTHGSLPAIRCGVTQQFSCSNTPYGRMVIAGVALTYFAFRQLQIQRQCSRTLSGEPLMLPPGCEYVKQRPSPRGFFIAL